MYTAELIQKIQFLNGTFTPSEARDLISKSIDEQIEFYKLQHLSQWMKDNTISKHQLEIKIDELQQKKQELLDMVKIAKIEDTKLNIRGDFKISLEN